MDILKNIEILKFNGIKAIIFDFDNTISSTNKSLFEVLSKLFLKEFNVVLCREDVMKILRMNSALVEMFESILNLKSNLQIKISAVDLYALFKTKYSDYQYYTEFAFLEWFKVLIQNKIKIAIVSNRKFGLRDRLRQLGFKNDDFIAVISRQDGFAAKPEPAMFMHVYDKLSKEGIKANQIISVGDHVTDFKISEYMGFHFFAYCKYTSFKDEFEDSGLLPAYIFENWNNFNKVLEEKFKQL
ncbi:hypothetical protein CL656_05505 [bacterium]|nr:hypothetical protein [bacterium]|tara:strand:- start:8305 stop:9030 length:726 start_codon:yes stop_codon:yes gene_type:complete